MGFEFDRYVTLQL